MRILKWTLISVAIILVGAQFVRPVRTNPSFETSRTIESHATVPREVAAVLKRACKDCHSHETVWPWYSNVAPVSWLLINHVNEGRSEMNFSDWARYDARQADHLLEELCKEVKNGNMPLSSYVALHPEAKLSDEEKQLLCD
ncbi:MAG TPA: heme-binding domain-containing protein, partial [Blastocatellia bacterium]|nr:heme-binding domain-containing protein [Blastocatellia bacterium]